MSLFLPLVPWTRYEYFHLDGTTLIPKWQKLVDQLNDLHGKVFVFLLSGKASRCGINLIGANRLILFDPGYVYINIFRVANPSWSLPPTIDQASQLQTLINSSLCMQVREIKIDCRLSQKVTYLFCDELGYRFKSLWVELGKQQKMLLSLRSNPQTGSPYIQNCDGLCTRTDHHMLLPIVLHMVVPLYLK